MKAKKTNLARAAMMLLLAVLTTTAWAQDDVILTATDGTGGTGKEGYDKLVDGLFSSGSQGTDWTKWGTSTKGTPSGESGSYYWVDFHSEAPINVAGYILTTGNDNATSGQSGRNPKSWVLKAKLNENDDWTTIATVTNDQTMQDVNFTSYEFDLDEGKSGTYQYFRFMISETKGADFMQLCELRLSIGDPTSLAFATISGLSSSYLYTGNAISINYTVKAFDGTVLNSTDHYNAVITKDGSPVTEVKDKGTYTLTITGKGNYTGTKSATFKVASEIMIGNPESTTTQYTLPVNMFYKHSLTQQIYTADEIGTAGTITAISFDYTHTASFSLEGVQVFMVQVDKDAFESNTDMVALDNATKVYDGVFTANGAGWVTIALDTPFEYDGTSNLLVCFYYPNTENANYLGTSFKFRTTATTESLAIIYSSDSAIPSIEDVSTFSGYKGTNKYRANIKLDITPYTDTDCPKPTAITFSDITPDSATVTWESDGDAWNLGLKAPGDADYTIVAAGLTEKTYTLNNLAENTKYSVGVQTVCSEESVSGFRFTTFTTINPCGTPTNLVVSNLTPTSATLSWTAGYQETSWTVKYKEASDSVYITETVSSPTITLSDLKGLTTYDVQVYNCTGENDAYLSGTFTTAADIPLVEEFDTSSSPTGWAHYSGLLNSVMDGTATLASTSYGWSFGNYNGVFDSHARVNIYGSSCNKWLVMPPLLMENNVELSFEVAYTAYSGTAVNPAQTGTDDKFVVLISTDDMATWTILRQWDNAEGSEYVLNDLTPTPVLVSIDLSSYAGQSVNVAFYTESTLTNADNNLHIDNVSIDYISDCPKPYSLKVGVLTAHTAQLSWTSDGSAWQICVNGDEDNLIDTTENPCTLENLTEETAFTAKVRTSCGGNSYSEWSNEVSFTTPQACPAPTDLEVSDITGHKAKVSWTGSSDSYIVSYRTAVSTDGLYEEFNKKDIPAHWSKYSGLVDGVLAGTAELETASSGWNTTAYALGAYNMKLNIYGTNTKYWLVTPEFTVSQDLTFDLALTDYGNADPIENDTLQADDRFIVLIYADEAWHILREWNNSGSTYVYNAIPNTGESVSIALTDYYNKDVKIAFYGESTASGGDNDLHIDNVIAGIPVPAGEWQTVTTEDNTCTLTGLLPKTDYEVKVEGACEGEQGHTTEIVSFTTEVACIAPSGLAASKVSPNSFELSWTENGEATAWQIQVNEEEPIDVAENPYTVTGLQPETEYSVKVRANGGEDGYSEWTSSITVTTLSSNPVPFDLAVSDITPTTATVSWSGFSESYNVYLGTDIITKLFNANFEDQSDLDNFSDSQDYPWTVIGSEGNSYMQSTNAGVASSTSAISVTVTYPMDGAIEFDAQCMGEGISTSYDKCVFAIDGVAQFTKGQNGEQWDHYIYEVAAGEHTFTWSYTKDSSVNPTGDYLAVDNVVMYTINVAWSDPIAVTDTEYTFDELTPLTDYRVKVEGVKGEDISEASEVVRFTTTETVGITFAKEGYGTYYNSERVVMLPAGMKARIVTAQENNMLTYETIADGDGETKTVVPATAMMLQVAPADASQVIDITLAKAPAMYVQRSDNLLHGSDVATTTTGNANDTRFYKLSYKNGTDIGWYWGTADGSPFTSAAHKAWLALPEAAAGARNFLSLPDFSDSQISTSIDDQRTAVGNEDGTWYSINGVKLDGQPTRKGLYIVNGQKKVVK